MNDFFNFCAVVAAVVCLIIEDKKGCIFIEGKKGFGSLYGKQLKCFIYLLSFDRLTFKKWVSPKL